MKSDEELAKIAVDLCLQIHRQLGPGLLEKVYEEAFCHELSELDIRFERQKLVPIWYKQHYVPDAFRYDVLVEGKLLLEFKSQDIVPSVEHMIVRSYLRLLQIRLGLLINFHVPLMKDGIRRVLNTYEPPPMPIQL